MLFVFVEFNTLNIYYLILAILVPVAVQSLQVANNPRCASAGGGVLEVIERCVVMLAAAAVRYYKLNISC